MMKAKKEDCGVVEAKTSSYNQIDDVKFQLEIAESKIKSLERELLILYRQLNCSDCN